VPTHFDHSSVTGTCASCHNGVAATGKPGNHFGTSLPCEDCHRPSGWTPIDFRHSSSDYPGDHRSSVVCVSCHQSNSQTATWNFGAYKPDCAGCHANDYKRDAHRKVSGSNINYTVSELRNCAGACHRYTDNSLTKIDRYRNNQHQTNHSGW
jgi:hypothetical protein